MLIIKRYFITYFIISIFLYLSEFIIILFIIFIIHASIKDFIIMKISFYFIFLTRCSYLFSLLLSFC